MHTARQLVVSLFAVRRSGAPAAREDLLPEWTPNDRLAVLVTEPFGAVGASHLIQLAITAFYDIRPTRRAGYLDGQDPRAIYPEIYLFHIGDAHGDHSMFDFWPARKEVLVDNEPRLVLAALNDRAITRLAVPDSDPAEVNHEHKEPAAARDRIATALVYSASGRVRDPEWEVAGLAPDTERNPSGVLHPDHRRDLAGSRRQTSADRFLEERSWPTRTMARLDEARQGLALAQKRRATIRNADGLATETYRGIDVDTAMAMLV